MSHRELTGEEAVRDGQGTAAQAGRAPENISASIPNEKVHPYYSKKCFLARIIKQKA